ncbi:hypothetical protein BWQ96_04400 [Gracilariopsis chorda]|uniref:Uncharacterized protein n=1 Tax=Gracilariopsis chorda TaxID=448386 RepID=A0A2V3IUR7_9FLOR|nr:hypothetical protein BWQ96_04400 [Gracilariopsis chorda]|eukprot:PXF45863.1 hypothetical protein BWQ96_04400 [Gracilariopsis chorda]
MVATELIGLVTDVINRRISDGRKLFPNPREVGRKLVRTTRVVGDVKLGVRDELRYTQLLRTMYPNDGEKSSIAVPRLDCLSDLEVQSIMNEAVVTEFGASMAKMYFKEWFLVGGELDRFAKAYFGPEAQLADAIAECDEITGSEQKFHMLLRACVDDNEEELAESVRRASSSISGHRSTHALSYISRLGSRHPGLFTAQRTYSAIPDMHNNTTFDSTDALQSKRKILALQFGDREILAYYEDKVGVAQVVRANSTGVQATCQPEDMPAPENMLISIFASMAADCLKSLGVVDVESITLSLLQACSRREDMAQIDRRKGFNVATDAGLLNDKYKFSTLIQLRRWLTSISRALSIAAEIYSQPAPQDTIRTGLTLREARKELDTPDYLYSRRDAALKLLESLMEGSVDSTFDGHQHRTGAVELANLFPTGSMHDIEEKLMNAMSRRVTEVQENYTKGSKKREVRNMSGSMWLDRIAKGKLLTSERAKQLTYARLRKDVPQEFDSAREKGFYLPLYKVVIVVPKVEELLNIRYTRLQVGAEADLTSAVSVLVACVLWANAQNHDVVEEIIRADKEGTGDLLKFSSGRLSVQLKKSLIKQAGDGNGNLSVGGLIDTVYRSCAGPMDKAWVIREVLALACVLGVTHTETSLGRACYLTTIERIRSCDKNVKEVLDADTAVPLDGVLVRQITKASGELAFVVVDSSLPPHLEVMLMPTDGCSEDEISTRIVSKKSDGRRLIAHMVPQSRRERSVYGSAYATLKDVHVQMNLLRFDMHG